MPSLSMRERSMGIKPAFLVASLLTLALVLAGCEEPVVKPPAEAEQAPSLERPGLDGEMVRLADYRGEVVLLNFWATWCPYCQEEIPHLVDLQSDLGAEGLQVVGVALNWAFNSQESGDPAIFPDKVGSFALENEMNYPTPLVRADMADVLNRFGNASGTIPYTLLIDREGRIRATFLGNPGEEKLRSAVQRLL